MLKALDVRKATLDDAKFLLDLKNDPTTRKNSLVSKGEIMWTTHNKWMSENIDNPLVDLNIVTLYGTPIADVRLNHGEETEISIRLDYRWRNKGLGKEIIGMFSGPYMAKIVEDNIASRKAFETNGYVMFGMSSDPVSHFILRHP